MTDIPQPDKPIPGHYRMKLAKRAVFVPVLIEYGQTPDPHQEGAPPLERWRWIAIINGEEHDVMKAWPDCSGEPITEDEYRYLLAMKVHAETYEPDLPQANPRSAVDWETVPLPQF